MNRPGLESLLKPFPAKRFLDEHWPNDALVLHHDLESYGAELVLPQLASAESVFSSCSGTSINAMMPDRKDESNSVLVTPEIAKKLYEAGMNMSIGNAEKFFPPLVNWVQNLTKDLGLPRTTWARSIVYLSPPKTGAPAHFDMNANFSLQLKGTKTWTIAPNANVTEPIERHVMMLEPTASLQSHSHDPTYPKELPKDAQVITLTPGSLLFVPRGWWHETTSDEECISLNFTFSQQSWAVMFALALVERLHTHEKWRKTPMIKTASTLHLHALRDEATALMEDVRRQVNEMPALDLLRVTSLYTHIYRRKEGVGLRRDGDAIALEIKGKGTMPIDTPPDYIPIFERIFALGQGEWFRIEDLVEHNSGNVLMADLWILLQRLAEVDVLESKDEG